MPVQTGSRIGPYEVEIALAAGGMGEVYRARDTRLNRRVAIKSLPAAFAQDPERVIRPGPGGKWQISNGPADDPTWSRTKHELLFVAATDLRIMRVPYVVEGDSFRAEKPQFWSESQAAALATRPRTPSRDLDLHPDGLRLAIAPASPNGNAKLDKVVLTFNFFDELKRITAKK